MSKDKEVDIIVVGDRNTGRTAATLMADRNESVYIIQTSGKVAKAMEEAILEQFPSKKITTQSEAVEVFPKDGQTKRRERRAAKRKNR